MKLKFLLNNLYSRIFIASVILFIFIRILGSIFYTQNKDFPFGINSIVGLKGFSDNIIVVEIDDYSLNQLSFPLPRETYIPFINNLKQAGASVVGFDIFFADKGNDSNIDDQLASTIKNAGNIVFGSDIKDNIKLVTPYDKFNTNLLDTGYFRPFVDGNNGKVYQIEPFREFKGGKIKDSFSFSILSNYFNKQGNFDNYLNNYDINNGFYDFYGKSIPIVDGFDMGRPIKLFDISYGDNKYFNSESFFNIYEGNFDKNLFKDKIVLVGYTAQGVKDDFIVPGFGNIKGVYIHANVISNVLDSKFMVYFNEYYETVFLFILIILILYLIVYFGNGLSYSIQIFIGFIILISVSLTYLYVHIQYLKLYGLQLYPNFPLNFTFVVIFAFLTSYILKYIIEDSNKLKLSKALGEYVSKDIADEILHGEGNVNLSGERKRISIFFSDIAGFTTISEKLSPEKLVGFLREYLGDMSKIIIDNKGFVNKYEGDAIMALWGVFTKEGNINSYDACYSALKQQEALATLNARWEAEGNDTFGVRMGIHTGDAIVGNIGAIGMKMEFTALGDAVNLGSRLEGVNKVYGTDICISEVTKDEVNDEFEFRYLDKIRVKGKNIPINIYELLSIKGKLDDLKKDIISKFDAAIELYLARDFEKALVIFKELSLLGDNPSKTYISRCELYLFDKPDSSWDGVWTMTEK